MKIDIQLISDEYISPSSPTAAHLRHHQLSIIDKVQPEIYMTWIMFYPKDDDVAGQQCDKLKKSLSEALTLFYPLAGRIKEDAYVDCNDQGAYFVQAKANCYLSDILDRQDPHDHHFFNPDDHLPSNDSPLASVQVTFFECGGLALFVNISHKVGDGASLFMFLNSWAAIARGDIKNIVTPRFESAIFFPPTPTFWYNSRTIKNDKEVVTTKRFVFSASSVATLVEKYTSNNGRRPSRFEALFAFIWSRLVVVHLTSNEKPWTPTFPINLRPRMTPTLSNDHFGNFVFSVNLTPEMYSSQDDPKNLVDKVREEAGRVDAAFVKDLQRSDSENPFFRLKDTLKKVAAGEITFLRFTSLTSFSNNSIDFGWGKPIWVAVLPPPTKNIVFFINAQKGDGIEAWLSLKEEDMAKFLTNEEFFSYVTV